MTQGIQHSTRLHEFSPAYLARITPKVRKQTSRRRDGWFGEALNTLARFLIPRHLDEVPEGLHDDVGLGTTAGAERGLRSEFNRLDAQLHARFY
jgi:hypothetical protein